MSLRDKLLKKQSEASLSVTDYERMKTTFVEKTQQLTDMIVRWFSELQSEQLATIVKMQVPVQDPHIGEYLAPSARIDTKNRFVVKKRITCYCS